MFLKNFWYVAAYDHEVGRQPMGRMILGEPIVFFRMEQAAALAAE
jgi:vanillate O-demethylase monooxygenase subunit